MDPYPSTNATILLLDSESVMRAALRDALESAGYLVVTASDLGDAVDRLNEIDPDFLLVRSYINSMPGQMAAEYLRSKHPGLRVLMIGAFLDDQRVTDQNTIENFHTFPKPFSRGELLEKVSEVLNSNPRGSNRGR